VQGGGNLGKRREIHVDCERADGGQRAKDDDDQNAVVGLGHKSRRRIPLSFMLEAGVHEFNKFLAGQFEPGPGQIRCEAVALT
jgi:hypothetical protein